MAAYIKVSEINAISIVFDKVITPGRFNELPESKRDMVLKGREAIAAIKERCRIETAKTVAKITEMRKTNPKYARSRKGKTDGQSENNMPL